MSDVDTMYTAAFMQDYEVTWSVSKRTEEERTVAIREFAVSEWCGDPEQYPNWPDEESVAANPIDFLDEEDGDVVITFEHVLS